MAGGWSHGTYWSSSDDRLLYELWGTMSARRIGQRMGGRSKSSIIGRAHRLCLRRLAPTPVPVASEEERRERRQERDRERRRVKRKGIRKAPMPGPVTLPVLMSLKPEDKPAPRERPAMQPMSSSQCCWPIGEPRTKGFRFCPKPAVLGRPYCAEHVRIAYVGRSRPL
jgi:GcrA cell cycle regulator